MRIVNNPRHLHRECEGSASDLRRASVSFVKNGNVQHHPKCKRYTVLSVKALWNIGPGSNSRFHAEVSIVLNKSPFIKQYMTLLCLDLVSFIHCEKFQSLLKDLN